MRACKHRESQRNAHRPLDKTQLQVVDLKAEVSRLKDQLERAAAARVEAVAVVEAQRDAAAEREEELRENLWKARQAAERVTISEEDAVIAVEREMRAEFETEMTVLKERATEAEERVRATAWYFRFRVPLRTPGRMSASSPCSKRGRLFSGMAWHIQGWYGTPMYVPPTRWDCLC